VRVAEKEGRGSVEGRCSRAASPHRESESGVALIIVVFAIALASMLVVSVTESTYIAGRIQTSYEQRFKAEYLLKSTLNFARVLIHATSKPGQPDPPKEGWGAFVNGLEVPLSMLGVNEPGVTVSLEIGGEDSKLPLIALSKTTQLNTVAPRFVQLFQTLGFDNDQEPDHSGLFKGRVFNAEAVVANIIDYLDADTTGASVGGATGVDAEVPADYFPNKADEALTPDELETIPGLTPKRLRRLLPHISISGVTTRDRINFNLATEEVLKAYYPSVPEAQLKQLLAIARGPEGPLSASDPRLAGLSSVGDETSAYQVIAKVQFGNNRYFLRAYLKNDPPNYPRVHGIELYG